MYFHRHIKDANVHEIHSIYENSWNKLTDVYYKNSSWPPAEAIAGFVNNDEVFLILYKELYYRHLYTKLNPTTAQRFESWQNYCDLFNMLLDANPYLSLELPNQWIWDIIDEFIYQFQSFCQFRAKTDNRPEDIELLKSNPQIWNALTVVNYLQSLISKSNIAQTLEKERNGHTDREHAIPQLYRMIGIFSIIGLLRLHVLMGDYYLALKVLDPIDLTNKGLYTRVTACHITLNYYLGFTYLMARRYMDAIKTLTNVLLFVSRTKQYHNRFHQYEQIVKKTEQMYALLSIAVSLCPQRIDENIHSTLREKYGDKMIRMQRGEEAVFKELFCFACPKFVTLSPPNYDELSPAIAQEALRVQLKIFLNEVRQQSQISTIRSFLKLYTTIGIHKLADYVEVDEDTFRMQLLCMKHKTRVLTWNGGSLLNTKWTNSSDVEFYVDQDMVHIANTKISRRFGEYFIRHITKFEEIINDIESGRSKDRTTTA